jgi:6-phosphogluconolactonase
MDSNGDGIYSVPFDCETGTFGAPQLLADCVNPSSLALSPDGKILFAGREVFSNDDPALTSFRVNADGTLTTLSNVPIIGELPCYLAFEPVQNRLASAQYWTGDVAISQVEDGTLQPPTYLPRTGHGLNATRQEGPHAHFVAFTDQGTVLHLVDLGTDSIVSHKLAADNTAVESISLNVPAGSGPRHMVLNHAETRAWVLCELDESLITLNRDGLGWVIDTIKAGFDAPVDEDGSGGTIRLSPDEAHIYISGRRQSQIAGFAVNGTYIGAVGCGGLSPREFIVTPDGNWVISANQNSNTLTSLRRDQTTGVLTQAKHSCNIGSPVVLAVF